MGIKSMQIKVMTANVYEVQIIPTEELYSKDYCLFGQPNKQGDVPELTRR